MQIKVLIIEDDPDDVFLIKEYLSQDKFHDYVFSDCSKLEDAITLIDRFKFDVILLDLGLPDAVGMEALDVLTRKETAGPIVVLTINDEELGEQAIKLGAADYLPKKHTDYITLSRSIRHAIERHGLMQRLKEKAETDPLTGLANRTMLYDKLEFMIAQCERSLHKFALVMIDFDKFKEINDTKGHVYGDQLLKAFAERLKSIMRKSDYAARFGGDEFLMIVSHFQDEKDLMSLIKLKQDQLSQAYNIILDGLSHRQAIEISMGVMLWEPGITAQKMLEMADEAMYRTKKDSNKSIEIHECLCE